MSRTKAPFARRPIIEELEPRLLFSADLAPLLGHVLAPQTDAAVAELRMVGTDGEFANATSRQQQAAQHSSSEVVFLDTRVQGYQQILTDIQKQNTDSHPIEVVLIDPNRDGIAQISDYLSQQQNISAIHIISHGADDLVQLGSIGLDLDSLVKNAAQIKAWGNSLTSDADILIYGCDVAQQADGKALVDALSRLTGADVAASTDLTGSAALGGNWVLEYQVGKIQTAVVLDAADQTQWQGVLVNTAPTLGNGTLAAVNEDTANPAGQTVSTIFNGQFSDPDAGASFTGIAVVGNSANAGTQGTWQYSTNGGSNWFAIGTVADNSTALALSSSTLIRFVPVSNYNGTPPTLTVRGLDNTYAGGFSTTAGSETRVNVNTISNGGTTAIAAATANLSTTITAVNDAPVGTGSATLAAINEDTASPAGATVSALFGANFSDSTDQVTGGSSANTFAGIAISSYTVDAAKGNWQYSTNTGGSWTPLGSATTTTAITLDAAASTMLRFVPASNYNGAATALSANLIESGLAITNGATINLTGVTGTTTHISSATVALGETITAVNDPPVAGNDSYTVAEDSTLTANWFDAAWTARQTLTFNNSAQSETLVNFPVLVVLNSGNIDYTKTQNNGADLRFFAADGTPLAYDIEQWNEAGTSYVWVKVPQITGGSVTDSITMYYGNAAAPAGANPEAVWGSSYRAVQFMDGTLLDVTANNNDGVNAGATTTPGKVGPAQSFNGVNSDISLGSGASIDDVFAGGGTVSAWIDPSGWGQNGYGRLLDKSNATLPTGGWALELSQSTSSLLFQQGFSAGLGSWWSANGSISLNTWQQVTVTYNSSSAGNVPIFYINGVQVGTNVNSSPVGAAVSDAALDLHVGNFSLGTIRTFAGAIDEVSVSGTVRSADWIHAEYLNETNAFVSFGPAQTAPTTSGVVANDSDVDSTLLTVALVSGPSHASAFTLNKDGTFSYTPNANFNGTDSFTYVVNDGSADSNVATATITVNAVNDAPMATGSATLAAINEDTVSPPGATVSSLFSANFSDATDQVTGGSSANPFAGIAISSYTVDASKGNWQYSTNGGSTWTTLSSATATTAVTLNATDLVRFVPAANYNGAATALAANLIESGLAITSGATLNLTGATGGTTHISGATVALGETITPVNDPPVVTTTGTTLSYTENAAATAIDPGLTVSDVDSANLTGATVTLSANYANGQDVLGFTNQLGITGSWNAGTGVLTLTGATTVANYQTALQNVTYFNSSDNPSTATRTVSFAVNDGVANSNTATRTISVTAVNDAPTVTDRALSFDGTDLVVVPTQPSLVMTSTLTVEATVQRTGALSGTQVIVNKEGEYEIGIAADGKLQWAFANTTPGWNWVETSYTIPADTWVQIAVTYNNGVVKTYANGTLVDTYNGTGNIGDVYPTMNDLSIGGRQNTTGQRFTGLIDEVRVWNVARSGAQIQAAYNTALAGNEAGLVGYWRFSESSGTTAVDSSTEGNNGVLGNGVAADVPSRTSNLDYTTAEDNPLVVTLPGVLTLATDPEGSALTAALVSGPGHASTFTLNPDGSFSYTPSANFNGIDSFVFAASDGSLNSPSATVYLTVTPVNDAPVASGSATLAAINEDTANPPGATVSALFSANFSDSTDQVTGGSTANTFAGVAISSYTVDASKGNWQYSTNGGTSWTTLASATATTAVTLNATDLLRFVPAANYNGSATALAANLIESGQAITSGATLNLAGATGGTTHISAGTVTLSETITAVNDAPVQVFTGANFNGVYAYNDSSGNWFVQSTPVDTGAIQSEPQGGVLHLSSSAGGSSSSGVIIGFDGSLKLADLEGGSFASTGNALAMNIYLDTGNDGQFFSFSGAQFTGLNGDSYGTVTLGANGGSFNGNTVFTKSGGIAALPSTFTLAQLMAGAVPGIDANTHVALWIGGGNAFSSDISNISLAASTSGSLTVLEDSGLTPLGLGGLAFGPGGGADEASQTLSYKVTSVPGVALGNVVLADGSTLVTANTNYTLAQIQGMQFQTAANANGGGATFAFTVQDSGGTLNGGVDTITKSLTINVTAVNDAPVASGSATLAAINEDTASPPGATVSSLFSANFSDVADQVSGGSSANTFAGIAISSYTVDASKGNWQYSTNGGTSWTTLSSTTTSTALTLNASDLLRFVPAANYNGAATALAANLIESGQAIISGATLNLTGATGGTTHISTATVALGETITSVNDAPVGTSKTVTTLEDTAYVFATSDFGYTDPSDSPANNLLNVKISTLPGAGTLTDNGTAVTAGQLVSVADISAGKLVFTPAANANGAAYASFTFQVQDNGGTANGGIDLDPTPKTITVDVTPVNHAPVGVPVITGTATENQTLSADTSGISDADGLGAFSYQWLRNGVAVAGATASTYTLGNADVGSPISVQVSYTDGHGTNEAVSSAPTAAVAKTNVAPPGGATIDPVPIGPGAAPETLTPHSGEAAAPATSSEPPSPASTPVPVPVAGEQRVAQPSFGSADARTTPTATSPGTSLGSSAPLPASAEHAYRHLLTNPETQGGILLRLLEMIQAKHVAGDSGHPAIAPAIHVEIAQNEKFQVEIITQGAQISAATLSVGAVWWALRAGGLFTGLLTSLPAWRSFDVLPVLGRDEDEDDASWEFDEDQDSKGQTQTKNPQEQTA
ncbi:MAG: DUF2341 domain-containing protein [Thiobacillaceae bacterium]